MAPHSKSPRLMDKATRDRLVWLLVLERLACSAVQKLDHAKRLTPILLTQTKARLPWLCNDNKDTL